MPKGNPTGYGFKMPAPSQGNTTLPPDRSSSKSSSGAPNKASVNSKYVGETKGNRDLPIDRTSGVTSGKAGTFIAGRNRPYGS